MPIYLLIKICSSRNVSKILMSRWDLCHVPVGKTSKTGLAVRISFLTVSVRPNVISNIFNINKTKKVSTKFLLILTFPHCNNRLFLFFWSQLKCVETIKLAFDMWVTFVWPFFCTFVILFMHFLREWVWSVVLHWKWWKNENGKSLIF